MTWIFSSQLLGGRRQDYEQNGEGSFSYLGSLKPAGTTWETLSQNNQNLCAYRRNSFQTRFDSHNIFLCIHHLQIWICLTVRWFLYCTSLRKLNASFCLVKDVWPSTCLFCGSLEPEFYVVESEGRLWCWDKTHKIFDETESWNCNHLVEDWNTSKRNKYRYRRQPKHTP